ncbi:MAG: bifunctional glutamate N-acetyltransferase/amino-acid acetyltransferase ArgJ [Gammaproteobacteria bacterium]|nr:bifunctional glutamate N-acetyltransferase/amino-acid acetyltransferase ArgJ [Gammaproteobacteria bacterium]
MADTSIPGPLAPDHYPTLPAIDGVRLATLAAGLRYQKRADLMLAALDEGTEVAGTFTRSLCPSAPVDWCKRILPAGQARALVCNAGNANAFTGRAGDTATEATANEISKVLGVEPSSVFLASTGVIGETLPIEALTSSLGTLAQGLSADSGAPWRDAADAIRTTDTFAKIATREAMIGDQRVTLNGIAKGSGMIAPDMATMLSFLFTDADIPQPVLQALLSDAVAGGFNSITVDSDTSTSDTVLLFATRKRQLSTPVTSADDSRLSGFRAALNALALELAHLIVRDGEGATKFVSVKVTGAASVDAAKRIALAIGNSPLVKTMLAAEDANWGRLVMAVGKAGEAANRDALKIWIGPEQVTSAGVVLDSYSEDRATEHLKHSEVELVVDVGVGSAEATIWTCDLTHGYIDINAGYRS